MVCFDNANGIHVVERAESSNAKVKNDFCPTGVETWRLGFGKGLQMLMNYVVGSGSEIRNICREVFPSARSP